MDKLTGIIDGVKNGWKKIDTKKRIVMVVLIISIILVASIISHYTNKVDYITLFNDLELEDSGIIVNDLEAKNISYKLENGGRKILIDEKLVDKYRLELAMNGMLPENSSGFELFDDLGLMVTDEDRKIMYQRALTGELQRSIMSLEAVNSAKVHLVMPEESIFETEKKEASASVIVDLKPSHKVTDNMIRGIAALISGAVDNLPEENIQIVDTRGNLLSSILRQNDNLNAGNFLSQYKKVQDEFEESLENNIYNLLASAFGREKIKVSIYADLDFDSEETTVITYYDPVTRSEQISATGSNLDAIQVTGGSIDDSISNVMNDLGSEGSTYNRTVNNELSSETKKIVKAPGKVNKLTASVLYDGILSEENAAKIQNIVAASIGYDVERGDLITVEGLIFDRMNKENLSAIPGVDDLQEENQSNPLVKYGMYIIYGLSGVLAIIILIALFKLLLSRRRTTESWVAQESLASIDTTDNTKQTIDPLDDIPEVKVDSKRMKAQEYAKRNPDVAADLIKNWIRNM